MSERPTQDLYIYIYILHTYSRGKQWKVTKERPKASDQRCQASVTAVDNRAHFKTCESSSICCKASAFFQAVTRPMFLSKINFWRCLTKEETRQGFPWNPMRVPGLKKHYRSLQIPDQINISCLEKHCPFLVGTHKCISMHYTDTVHIDSSSMVQGRPTGNNHRS